MRKLFVALLVGAVAVGLAAPAYAADLKFTGAYRVRFQFDDNLPCFTEAAGTDCSGHDFQARFRPRFDVETEGGVKGVIRLEIGDLRFGTINKGTAPGSSRQSVGGIDADAVNIETKWAYIDFPIPATPLRLQAGVIPFFTSKALVLDADGPGVSLYGKLGQVDVNAWWFRANSVVAVDATGVGARDLYAIDASVSPVKDLKLNVYFLYDHDMETPVGGETATGYFIGAAGSGKVQNIGWDLDFVYGSKETGLAEDTKGWIVDGGINMALPGTPLTVELRGWYASGEEDGTGDIDIFPDVAGGWESGAQIFSGGGDVDIDEPANNPQNTWGVGLIARYAATPQLRLTANAHYIGTVEEGTAAFASPIATSALEGLSSVGVDVGLKADYTIHRGLVFTVLFSYLFLTDDTSIDPTTPLFDDVLKFAGVLNYGF